MPEKLNGQTFWKTAEACALAGTNRNTYLRWVRQGVFTDVSLRDRNDWRLFTEEDIRRLRARVQGVGRTGVLRSERGLSPASK